MAETGSRNDPFAAFNFLVDIGGALAGFSECSGLTLESDVIEYRNGNEDITVRKLPGLKKFTNIVLKRGYTNAKELWDWRKTVLDGKTERRDGTITLLNEARQPALRWNFYFGWPSKWEGPTMNAKTNDVAIETLNITVEKIELAE
jgi:phage tail-like protein